MSEDGEEEEGEYGDYGDPEECEGCPYFVEALAGWTCMIDAYPKRELGNPNC